MSDLFGSIDPQRLALAAMVAGAFAALFCGSLAALMIWALSSLKRDADRQDQTPDPFSAPQRHEGLPIRKHRADAPPARARPEAAFRRPGTP